MRPMLPWTIAVAALVAVALPASAHAQDPASPPSQSTPGATTPGQAPPQTPTPGGGSTTSTPPTSTTGGSSSSSSGSGWWSGVPSHWTAAGFVGSNFGAASNSSSVDFGGQVGYLYRGIVGGEFLADFAPNFNLNNALLSDMPNVNAYMANAIVAVPIGSDGQLQPYISAGFGGVQLRSNVLSDAAIPLNAQSNTQIKPGGDIGFGLMGFARSVGIRGDVRYFRAFTSNTTTTGSTITDVFAQNLLSGLDFWRANIGVALRW